MNSGCSFSSHARLSSSLPRKMSVCSFPVEERWRMSSPSAGSAAPSGRASSTLVVVSCNSETLFSKRQRPRCMMPTWSHTSSSSRRLWEDTSTVVPSSATSSMTSDHTCRRITGSSPSTGSSSTSTSGLAASAIQNADCFCMPRERRRMGRVSSSAKISRSFS